MVVAPPVPLMPYLSDTTPEAAADGLAAAEAGAEDAGALTPPQAESQATADKSSALKLYRQARDREPKNAEAWYQLGAFELHQLKQPRAAYRDLNQAYTYDRYIFTPGTPAGRDLDRARCLVDPSTCR